MEQQILKIPTLKTERLILRKFKKTDIEDFIKIRADERLYVYQGGISPKEREGYVEDLNRFIECYNLPRGSKKFAIEFNKTIVGIVGIERYNNQIKMCSMGWTIRPEFQQQGIAYEACKKIIDWLFNKCDINRIEAFVWQGNEASKRLTEKLGFVLEGVARQARILNGKFIDVYNFGLIKDDYLKEKK